MRFFSRFAICWLITTGASAQDFDWARRLGGAGVAFGVGIALDSAGNVYTTGFFTESIDLDPGAGVFNLIAEGVVDIFISKLDATGNFVWAKRLGGPGVDGSFAIALDDAGHVYTTGSFGGTMDFDPGVGVFNLTAAGSRDIFISKLDPAGNFVWAKRMGGSDRDEAYAIALDSAGHVYTTGRFSGTADFDPGPDTFNLTSAGSSDVFVSRLDADGNFMWAKNMGGSGEHGAEAFGIALDGAGHVYTTGRFSGTADFDPSTNTFDLTSAGGTDIFISKLDAAGNFVWAKRAGGSGPDVGFAIVLDEVGQVHTTGRFSETADFDPGTGTFNLTSAGLRDIFMSKLDAAGDFVGALRVGGTNQDVATAIVLDTAGNVYTTGHFRETVNFDPGVGTFNLTSAGNEDVFVLKLSQSPVSLTEPTRGSSVMVYPNPSSGQFYVQYEGTTHIPYTINNVLGKVVRRGVLNGGLNRLSLVEETAGVYFLHLPGHTWQLVRQ